MPVVSVSLTARRIPVVILGEAPAVTQAHRILFEAWNCDGLRLETILAVHAIVCPESGACPGRIREGNVVVRLTGNVRFRAPIVSRVQPNLEALMAWLNDRLANPADTAFPVDVAAEFAWRLCNVHPFQDGNGRVARAISSWILATCGYGVIRPSDLRRHLYAQHSDYYDTLRTNDAGDAGPWRHLFADAVSTCMLPPSAYRTVNELPTDGASLG